MGDRVKENAALLSIIIDSNKIKAKGTSEELTCWHLCFLIFLSLLL